VQVGGYDLRAVGFGGTLTPNWASTVSEYDRSVGRMFAAPGIGESAHQLALAVLLESPCSGEADGRNTGDDAEPPCHGARARREMDEFRFVHG
jgi:hypothetical protein